MTGECTGTWTRSRRCHCTAQLGIRRRNSGLSFQSILRWSYLCFAGCEKTSWTSWTSSPSDGQVCACQEPARNAENRDRCVFFCGWMKPLPRQFAGWNSLARDSTQARERLIAAEKVAAGSPTPQWTVQAQRLSSESSTWLESSRAGSQSECGRMAIVPCHPLRVCAPVQERHLVE